MSIDLSFSVPKLWSKSNGYDLNIVRKNNAKIHLLISSYFSCHTHAQLRIWNLYFGYSQYICLLKLLLLVNKLSKLLTVGKSSQTYWHLMCHIIQELLKAVNSSFELSKLSKVLIELKHQIPRSVVHLATFDSVAFSFCWNINIKKSFAQLRRSFR